MPAMATTRIRYGARPEQYPVVGAVALDAMAAIAGPAGAPGYERAWSAAFAIVSEAMVDARESCPA